jgi:hypothetical protein
MAWATSCGPFLWRNAPVPCKSWLTVERESALRGTRLTQVVSHDVSSDDDDDVTPGVTGRQDNRHQPRQV